jgi:hypothetical protein
MRGRRAASTKGKNKEQRRRRREKRTLYLGKGRQMRNGMKPEKKSERQRGWLALDVL